MKRLAAATLILTLLAGSAFATWFSWAQIWGKDETMPENIDLNRAHQENLLIAGNSLLFGKDLSALRFAANNSHAAGLKIVGQLSNTILTIDNPDAPALVAASVEAIKYNGQKFVDWYITTCPNQPAWRNYQKEIVRGIASAEVDGFGTIYGDWLVERCFCSSCEAHFHTYLNAHYTPSQLATFGIPDINTFDYSDYLNARGVTQTQIEDDSDKSAIPLLEDFYKMKEELAIEYLNELTAVAKAYGKSDIIIMNGAEGCGTAKYLRLPAMEVYSYYTNFEPLSPIFSYKENTQAIHYKILKAMHPNSALIAGIVDESAGGIIQNTGDPQKYIYGVMAEALANKTIFYDQDRVGLWSGAPLGWSIDPAINLKIKTFLQNYFTAFDYGGLQSCAKIGILYSSRSLLKADRVRPDYGEFSIAGIGKALAKISYQYDIIFNGDGELVPETVSPSLLSRYELIILPETTLLTENEKQALTSYVNNGGKLLAYADIDSTFSLTPGETTQGSGRIYYEPTPLLRYYNGTASETYLRTIEAQVNNYLSSKTVYGISQTHIISQIWKTANPERVYLHLINHDIENKVSNLLITMEVPANFGPDRLYLASPDLAEQELPYAQSGQSITFTVPELDVWDLLILTSTQEAQQSATRESIIKSMACGPNPASTDSTILYTLSEPASIKIRLYQINGELIRVLTDTYSLGDSVRGSVWDLKGVAGGAVPNGVYLFFLEATGVSGKLSREKGKIIVLR